MAPDQKRPLEPAQAANESCCQEGDHILISCLNILHYLLICGKKSNNNILQVAEAKVEAKVEVTPEEQKQDTKEEVRHIL